ncbi:MAG: hypothetical protein NTNFB01_22700 [Nitrospira sp.]
MGKKMTAAQEKIEPRFYELKEAVEAVKQAAFAKYENPSTWRFASEWIQSSDQMVRGTTALPHGTGRSSACSSSPRVRRSRKRGRPGLIVGSDDLMEKIKGGWMDFDCAISCSTRIVTVFQRLTELYSVSGIYIGLQNRVCGNLCPCQAERFVWVCVM